MTIDNHPNRIFRSYALRIKRPCSNVLHTSVTRAKELWYGDRGEPIQYGPHRLRYVPGTRPVRLRYMDSPDAVVRNDALQIAFFLDHVKPGDLMLDIGGHFGQYAVLFASLVSDSGLVITFEPDREAKATLRQNVVLNGFSERVEIESLALFDQVGEHTFFSRGADSMSSLARSGLGTNALAPEVVEYSVKTARLDDFMASRNLPFPAFVKLDTEGAEINILRGAKTLLGSSATIVCELHPYVWNEFGSTFEELLKLVDDSGKTIEYLDPSMRIRDGAYYGAAIIS
jgi:FkbM family methyltransferase